MANGMNIPTLAPRPVPRPWATAMTTYVALDGPEFEPDGRGAKRWLGGVKFIPFGCERAVGQQFDPCVTRLRTDPVDVGAEVDFDAFEIEVGSDCTLLSMDEVSLVAHLTGFMTAHMEMSRSAVIGEQVMAGTYAPGNPSLMSEAQVLSGIDRSLLGAMEAIEDALADVLDGGQGMIHLPAALLTAFQSGGGLRFMPGPDGVNRYYTATGHIVVADAGYLGPSPVSNGAVDGEVWIYGSGPIFVKLDDEIRIDGLPSLTSFDPHNTVTMYANQSALAIFEPCSVVAAAVDTSPSAPDLEEL